jgi:hypothetical protein
VKAVCQSKLKPRKINWKNPKIGGHAMCCKLQGKLPRGHESRSVPTRPIGRYKTSDARESGC